MKFEISPKRKEDLHQAHTQEETVQFQTVTCAGETNFGFLMDPALCWLPQHMWQSVELCGTVVNQIEAMCFLHIIQHIHVRDTQCHSLLICIVK